MPQHVVSPREELRTPGVNAPAAHEVYQAHVQDLRQAKQAQHLLTGCVLRVHVHGAHSFVEA